MKVLFFAIMLLMASCTFKIGKSDVEEFNCRTGFTRGDFNVGHIYIGKNRDYVHEVYGKPARVFTEYNKDDGKMYDVESYRGTAWLNTTSYEEKYDHAFQKYRLKEVTKREESCIYMLMYYEHGKDIVVKVLQKP